MHLSPQYSPAAINLADLYRSLGRDSDSESVLRTAIASAPRDAGLHHSLGLALVRSKRSDEALDELRKATELDPGQARYAYVYAVALHSAGHANEALTALKENLDRHPNDRDTLVALISFNRESGDINSALQYAERLHQILPDAQDLTRLIQDLRRQTVEPDCTLKFWICPCPTVICGVLIERTLLCTELQEIASRSGFSQTGSGHGSEHGACSRAILTHFILGYGVTWSHHRNGTSNSGGKSRLLHSAALSSVDACYAYWR